MHLTQTFNQICGPLLFPVKSSAALSSKVILKSQKNRQENPHIVYKCLCLYITACIPSFPEEIADQSADLHQKSVCFANGFPLYTSSYIKWTVVSPDHRPRRSWSASLRDSLLSSPGWMLDEKQECAPLTAQPPSPRPRPHFTCHT